MHTKEKPLSLLLPNAIMEVMDGYPASIPECFGVTTDLMLGKLNHFANPVVNALAVARVFDPCISDEQKEIFYCPGDDGRSGLKVKEFSSPLQPGTWVNDFIMKHGVQLLNEFNGPSNNQVWFMNWYDVTTRTERKGGTVLHDVRGQKMSLPQIAENFEAIVVPINNWKCHWILAVYLCKKNILLTYDPLDYTPPKDEQAAAREVRLKPDSHHRCIKHYIPFVAALEKKLGVGKIPNLISPVLQKQCDGSMCGPCCLKIGFELVEHLHAGNAIEGFQSNQPFTKALDAKCRVALCCTMLSVPPRDGLSLIEAWTELPPPLNDGSAVSKDKGVAVDGDGDGSYVSNNDKPRPPPNEGSAAEGEDEDVQQQHELFLQTLSRSSEEEDNIVADDPPQEPAPPPVADPADDNLVVDESVVSIKVESSEAGALPDEDIVDAKDREEEEWMNDEELCALGSDVATPSSPEQESEQESDWSGPDKRPAARGVKRKRRTKSIPTADDSNEPAKRTDPLSMYLEQRPVPSKQDEVAWVSDYMEICKLGDPGKLVERCTPPKPRRYCVASDF